MISTWNQALAMIYLYLMKGLCMKVTLLFLISSLISRFFGIIFFTDFYKFLFTIMQNHSLSFLLRFHFSNFMIEPMHLIYIIKFPTITEFLVISVNIDFFHFIVKFKRQKLLQVSYVPFFVGFEGLISKLFHRIFASFQINSWYKIKHDLFFNDVFIDIACISFSSLFFLFFDLFHISSKILHSSVI